MVLPSSLGRLWLWKMIDQDVGIKHLSYFIWSSHCWRLLFWKVTTFKNNNTHLKGCKLSWMVVWFLKGCNLSEPVLLGFTYLWIFKVFQSRNFDIRLLHKFVNFTVAQWFANTIVLVMNIMVNRIVLSWEDIFQFKPLALEENNFFKKILCI